ncbi:olfactory receptor 5V1-like [Rana temporaria]|uniref:olfactory receptor 5V1-like n=1 Tax=Rana temporaria TaxID=8407 RepID=UPI001AAC7454|nr:olfactory receptor 5V1-like [Rana temporaria]
MEEANQTFPERFILLGLSNVLYLQAIFFIVFLVMYIITLSVNLLLIIVVSINPRLHTPMYFFLINLSIIDICFPSTTVPKILVNTLVKDRSISLLGCAGQMFFHLALGSTECLILAIMAYDRFAAICRPLHYKTIMNKMLCVSLTAGAWSISFLNSALQVVLTFQLPYCNSRHVNHFFCEVPPFLQMACGDTLLNTIAMYIAAGAVAMSSFFLTLISYVYIISNILKISSSQGRLKTFSTCGSHLTVVTLYYGTIMSMYLTPHSNHSPEIDKTVSILYTAVTPMLNPIVYSIRNKDVINTVKYTMHKIL